MGSGRTLEEWRSAARTAGLDTELLRFAEGWRAAPGEALVLDYAELVSDTAATMRKALDFFGYTKAAPPALAREKFTRDVHVPMGERLRRSLTRLKTAAGIAVRRSRQPPA
jgi:hypothetical protein